MKISNIFLFIYIKTHNRALLYSFGLIHEEPGPPDTTCFATSKLEVHIFVLPQT